MKMCNYVGAVWNLILLFLVVNYQRKKKTNEEKTLYQNQLNYVIQLIK